MSSTSGDSLFSEEYFETSSEHSIENTPAVQYIRNLTRVQENIEHIMFDRIDERVNNNDHISTVSNKSEIEEFSTTSDVDEEYSTTSSNEFNAPPSWDGIYEKHFIALSKRWDASTQSKFLVESWIHSTRDVNIWASEKPTEHRPSEINEALSILRKHKENNPWFYDTTDRCISLPTYGKIQHSLVQQYYSQPQLWSSGNEDDESDDIFEARRTNEVRHRSMRRKLIRRVQHVATAR